METLEQIEVAVELGPSLARFASGESGDGERLRGYLLRYLNGLVADLELPLAVSLVISSQGDERAFTLIPYRVALGGHRCKQSVPDFSSEDVEVEALARSVARTIERNRDLLLGSSLCETIRQRWSPGGVSAWPSERFHEYLLALVRRGFGIGRGRSFLQRAEAGDQSELSASQAFEQTVATIPPDFQLLLPAAPPSSTLEVDLLDPLQTTIFDQLGIFLPRGHISTDDGLEPDEWRVKVNDLRLSPRSGLDDGEPPADDLQVEVRSVAGALLTSSVVAFLLSVLSESAPELVKSAQERLDLFYLTGILRELLEEEISIRGLRNILEGLLAINGLTRIDPAAEGVFLSEASMLCFVSGPEDLRDVCSDAEFVRTYVRDDVLARLPRSEKNLFIYNLAPDVEDRLRSVDERPLSDEEHDRFVKALYDTLGQDSFDSPILTNSAVRKRLKREIARELPRVAVVTNRDLLPGMVTIPLGEIDWR